MRGFQSPRRPIDLKWASQLAEKLRLDVDVRRCTAIAARSTPDGPFLSASENPPMHPAAALRPHLTVGLTNPAPAETIGQLHPRNVGLWRSWERASMAWKRSSVRSRSGPPNNPFILRYLPTPTRRGLVSRGCGRVLKFLNFQRQHSFNDFHARFALLLRDRAGVNIKRRAATRMPHQFLSDLNVDTKRSQVGREGVTETVPTDMFSDNSDPRQCGTNALLQDAVRTERLIPFESN